jgi:4-carboxymuconolactone decarboxylase
MTRIPPPVRDDMDVDQQAVYDRIVGDNGRVGFGPAIGYAHSGPVWDLHNVSSKHLLDCSLTAPQVRIISLMTVHHWNAAYPWSAQAKTALNAGLNTTIIEAINAGEQPDFENDDDAAVHAVTRELLATGNLSDKGFKAAEATLGHRRMVEIVHTIGHFCTTGMMANMVGCVPPEDAVSRLKS